MELPSGILLNHTLPSPLRFFRRLEGGCYLYGPCRTGEEVSIERNPGESETTKLVKQCPWGNFHGSTSDAEDLTTGPQV